jgi:hypothetical protein
VNGDYDADHFGQNYHAAHMGFYFSVFSLLKVFFGFAYLFKQYPLAWRESSMEASSLP